MKLLLSFENDGFAFIFNIYIVVSLSISGFHWIITVLFYALFVQWSSLHNNILNVFHVVSVLWRLFLR